MRPCVKVHISNLRFFNFSLKTLLPYLQRQAVPPYSSVIRKASFLKFSAGLNSELVFMHFLLGYERLNHMQRRTKREAVRYSRTGLFTVPCIIIHWYCIVIIGTRFSIFSKNGSERCSGAAFFCLDPVAEHQCHNLECRWCCCLEGSLGVAHIRDATE